MSQPPPPPFQPPSGPPGGTPEPEGSGASQGQSGDSSSGPGYGYPNLGKTPPPPPAPPQGGFGAPTPPPQGGFGAPTPPPPGGGYGTPPPPPSYGYPGPPQGATPPQYGQQPYGQPQYGYPPQPQYPGAGGMPPQGGGGKQRTLAIVSVVVAVLLVIGAGVWFATSGGDDKKKDEAGTSAGTTGGTDGGSTGGTDPDTEDGKPATEDAKLLFTADYPHIKQDVFSVVGSWATEKTFAKSQVYSIVGYGTGDGHKAWELKLDGEVCAASKFLTNDGRAAVIFQEGKLGSSLSSRNQPCSQLALIDIDSGRKVWQKTMPGGDGASSLGMGVTIGRGTVVASWLRGSVAYTADDKGKQLWNVGETASCRAAGYGGGKDLVAVMGCPSPVSGPFKVQKIDPATGDPKWTYEVPEGIQTVSVISSDPVVITIGAGEVSATDIISLDDQGKLRAKLSLERGTGGAKYDPNCNTEVESCVTAAVGKDTLYLPSKEHQGQSDYGQTNEIIAFDLATGRPRWKSDAGEKRLLLPLRMDGDKLIAYRQPTYDSPGQIVGIEPDAGKQTVYLRLPTDSIEAENSMSPEYDEVDYAHGRLFLSKDILSNRKSTTDEYLLLGFG